MLFLNIYKHITFSIILIESIVFYFLSFVGQFLNFLTTYRKITSNDFKKSKKKYLRHLIGINKFISS